MSLHILGGEFKGRSLKSPKGSATRPTQGILRQSVFNICQQQIQGARFLDLFAGSGAMGLEALSRGAKQAVFVEKDRFAIRAIRENIAALEVEGHSELLAADLFSALKELAARKLSFDLIYIDPPYDRAPLIANAALAELEKLHLIAPEGLVFVEESSQGDELSYSSDDLRKKNTRKFGIARLHQFEYTQRD